jgi:hypothetical protein
VLGDGADTFGVAHRRTSIFLHDERHAYQG